MSRYIDANRLLSERMQSKYYHLPNGDIAIPIIDIEQAPSINIVYCKECDYADFSGLPKDRCYCMQHSCYMYDSDFCSLGNDIIYE